MALEWKSVRKSIDTAEEFEAEKPFSQHERMVREKLLANGHRTNVLHVTAKQLIGLATVYLS